MMKKLHLLFTGLLFLMTPTLGWSMPVTDFVDTLFIGGGVMLFLSGIIMLFIPGLFRTGIMTTVIADILFVSRMLFPHKVDDMIAAQTEWLPMIDHASMNTGRIYTAVLVICTVIAILCARWLLRSLFGSHDKSQKAKNKQTKQKPAPQKQKTRLNRDRDDFNGYEEESLPPEPATSSPTHTKRFRVHDYLENLEKQQAYEASVKQRKTTQEDSVPTIHFDRIER